MQHDAYNTTHVAPLWPFLYLIRGLSRPPTRFCVLACVSKIEGPRHSLRPCGLPDSHKMCPQSPLLPLREKVAGAAGRMRGRGASRGFGPGNFLAFTCARKNSARARGKPALARRTPHPALLRNATFPRKGGKGRSARVLKVRDSPDWRDPPSLPSPTRAHKGGSRTPPICPTRGQYGQVKKSPPQPATAPLSRRAGP